MSTDIVKTEKLHTNPNVINYINYVYNLIHELQSYINVFKQDVQLMYKLSKDFNPEEYQREKNATIFIMANADNILMSRCVTFATRSRQLLDRKIIEIFDTLSMYLKKGKFEKEIEISNDIFDYYDNYQVNIDFESLAYGSYHNKEYGVPEIYDLNKYALLKEKELSEKEFNTIKWYDYTKLKNRLDWGYRESLNTFIKLRKLLDRSNSLYTSLIIIHVYIDILILSCYTIEYVYAKITENNEGNEDILL